MFYANLPPLPYPELKRLVITRRIDMLMRWADERYGDFEAQEQPFNNLIDFIELVIDALCCGLPKDDWQRFDRLLKAIRNDLTQDEQTSDLYHQQLLSLKESLKKYRGFIQTYEFQDNK